MPNYCPACWRHLVKMMIATCILLITRHPCQSQAVPVASATQQSFSNLPVASMKEDIRLNRTVTLEEAGTPLRGLLVKLSTKDLPLSVDLTCAEQKLHIRLKNRSLRVLMQALADLLIGEWHRRDDNGGYGFSMSSRAIRRRDNWWQLFLSERDKAISAQRALLLNAMRAPLQLGEVDSADGNHDGLRAQLTADHDLYRALPADLQEHIASQMNDVVFYSPWLPIGTSMDEGGILTSLHELPPSAQKLFHAGSFLGGLQAGGNALADAYVQFQNCGSDILSVLLSPQGKPLGLGGKIEGVPFTQLALPLYPDHSWFAVQVAKMGKDAPDAWKQLAAYQNSRVWNNDRPAKFYKTQAPSRAETLAWLGKCANIEFVADYYSVFNSGTRPEIKQIARPLMDELNWQAAELDTSWKQQGDNLYLFRDNRWYRDDRLEVPDAIQKRLLAQYAQMRTQREQQGNRRNWTPEVLKTEIRRGMDWQTEVVTTLTPWQIFNGLPYASPGLLTEGEKPFIASNARQLINNTQFVTYPQLFPLRNDVWSIAFQYGTNLFYAGLNNMQRASLLDGQLDYTTLSEKQQEQARYLLPLIGVQTASNPGHPLLLTLQPKPVSMGTTIAAHLAIANP